MPYSAFKAAGYDWRLFVGPQVIEQNLAASVKRAGATRAFIICSPSINQRTATVERIKSAVGDAFAGVYDGIAKDSTFASVQAAKQAAEDAGADLLIAVGGGSVLVAARAVAIYMGESGDPFDLMTQYPEGKPAFSLRLNAPKPPIINIPTTPTSAMNRAGTGLKNPDIVGRMEYFDPKTRPQAVLLDDEVLLGAPMEVIRSTATTVFASTLAGMAQTGLNPLVEGNRDQAFKLAHRAYIGLMHGLDDPNRRRDLALAAFLQNRAEDDGKARFAGGIFAGDYAISTALHVIYPHIGQGESTSVVHAPAIRVADAIPEDQAQQVASALCLWNEGMNAKNAAQAVANRLESIYTEIGMPIRLRQLEVPKGDLHQVAAATLRNFNANAGMRSEAEQIASAMRLLEAAW
jgi:alcohol dehydrogenase class IV